MGYRSHVHGEIDIHPPATWAELRGADILFNNDDFKSVWVEVESQEVETPEGTLVKKQGRTIVAYDEDFKAYDLEKELQAIADALPGHEFLGHLQRDGEESADLERYYIRSGKVITRKPQMIWPEV